MEYVRFIRVLANPSVNTWVIWVLFNCGCVRVESSSKKVQEFMFMKTHATLAWIPLKRTRLKFKQKVFSIPCKIDAQANKDPSSNKNFARSLTQQLLERTNLNVRTETLLNPRSSEFAANVAFFAQFPIFNPMFYLTYISPALLDFLFFDK